MHLLPTIVVLELVGVASVLGLSPARECEAKRLVFRKTNNLPSDNERQSIHRPKLALIGFDLRGHSYLCFFDSHE